MNKLILIISLLFFYALSPISGQEKKKSCQVKNLTFQSGEKLSYTISYNWLVVFSEVGLVEFTIKNDMINGKEAYHFKATGQTFSWWDKFFKVRDSYETWVLKDNLRPQYFQRNTREGDYRQHENYTFQGDTVVYRKNKIKDNPFNYDTIKVDGCSFDVMSALLYTRNLDFAKYKINDKIPVTVVLDDKPYDLYFRYLGNEDKKIKDIGTFECMKFTVLLVEGTMFKEGEDMFLWVTNDANRIPVYVESPILIGSVKGYITKIEGNRYPLTSLKK